MNWKGFLCQVGYALLLGILSSVIGFEPMVIGGLAIICGYLFAKDIGWLSHDKEPFVRRNKKSGNSSDAEDENEDYGTKFYVISMGDGKFSVTRSKFRGEDGRILTRGDIYKGDMDLAQCMYCHEFMCCSWNPPYGGVNGDRPSKEVWLAQKPYEFEIDMMLTRMVFGEHAYVS